MSSPAAPHPRRFTRTEYHRMGDAGLFQAERVELLDGEVIAVSPQGTRHASVVQRITQQLIRRLDEEWVVRCRLPIALDAMSEPEPDIVLCRPVAHEYEDEHPLPADIVLLAEVADSSLAFDLTRKSRAYARGGIAELWIIDLVHAHVEVFRSPDPPARVYRVRRRATAGGTLALPGGYEISVADLLPRR